MLRVTGRRRRYWEMMAAVRVPVLLIGGDADRLVPVAAIRQAGARQPRWDTVVLAGVGHTPQLEVPDLVVGTVQDWLERHFTRPQAEEERDVQQLTGLDASFLALETANTTGHVGGLSVLDPSGAPKPLTLARLTEVMAERLPLVPVLRRKLLNVPLGLDQPYWIDDPDFDIEYHVREIALPRPGSDAQLTEQVSRLHARPLDRSRPLWELYLITGLARRRAAVYTKIHHAAIDGASGAELLTVLLDLKPGRP